MGVTTDSTSNKIEGATDLTEIGNVGDRLKVDANITNQPTIPNDSVIHFNTPFVDGSSNDMTVDGSTTAVEFTAGPGAGEIWYIFEIGLSIEDSGNNTIDRFGAITELTNGVLIEQTINSTDYEFENLTTNLDIIESFTDHFIRGQANSFLNAGNFFSGKLELRVPVTLVGDNGDEFKMTVRDDLTGLNTLRGLIEGYRVL